MFLKNWSQRLTERAATLPFFEEKGKLWRVLGFHREKETKKAVKSLIEKSRLEISFFVMCGLSGSLACLGILLNDIPILISAMVLAPLLNPLLAFAAGIALFNKRLIFYATKSFFGGLIFVITASALFTKILLLEGHDFDVTFFAQKFANISMLFFFAAFISGFSGVYAWLKAKDLSSLIGVAIAVSLIPFVSFFGILWGMQEFIAINNLLFPFFINLISIILGALVAFVLLGFSRKVDLNDEIEQQIVGE